MSFRHGVWGGKASADHLSLPPGTAVQIIAGHRVITSHVVVCLAQTTTP